MNIRLLGGALVALSLITSACDTGGGLVTAQGTPKPKSSPTPIATPTAVPSTTPTPVSHPSMTPTPTPTYTLLSAQYTLTSSGETIVFPQDGDATGSANVPPITSPTVQLDLSEDDQPISAPSEPSSPGCSEPIYWYSTLDLDGTAGDSTNFTSSDIPLTFSSPTLVTSGHLYGLCVVALGLVVQDDFNKKIGGAPPVSPSGDSADLTLVIPAFLGGSFPNQKTAFVYFEKK